MTRIRDSLPVLYRDLLPPLFEEEIPAETKATCSSCSMCASSCRSAVESVDGNSRLFRPDTKCCTYHPRLPNYLVGALLSDEDALLAEGRRRIEEKIQSRVGVSPQWLKPPAKYNLLYDNARRAFGRAESLLCPYFDKEQGMCTVWPYREAVCSTFYCKYVAGADGRGFWMSLKTYLALVEIQLSRYAIFRLCPDYIVAGLDREGSAAALGPRDLDEEAPSEKDYKALWRAWSGREVEFYKTCFALVRSLPKPEFERFLGLDGTLALEVLEHRHRALVSPRLPDVLAFNPDATVKWLPDGSVALGAYSEFDAIALPGAAYGLLVEFTGKEPVAAVRARLRKEKQADLFEDVLFTLYRHRVLIAA